MPSRLAPKIVIDPPADALKPWCCDSLVMRLPIVSMIFHPPAQRAQPHREVATDRDPVRDLELARGDSPVENSRMVMIPIVFCASLSPWLSEKACRRKSGAGTRKLTFRSPCSTRRENSPARHQHDQPSISIIPISGETHDEEERLVEPRPLDRRRTRHAPRPRRSPRRPAHGSTRRGCP